MKSDTCEDTTRVAERLGRNRTRAGGLALASRFRSRAANAIFASQSTGNPMTPTPLVGVAPEAEGPHLQASCAFPSMPGGEVERGTPFAQLPWQAVPRNGKRTVSEERVT